MTWEEVAKEAARKFLTEKTSMASTIQRHAADLNEHQIKRACEMANHLVNAQLLRSGSRYPTFETANPKTIAKKAVSVKEAEESFRKVGTYVAGDELIDQYMGIFDKLGATAEQQTAYEKPSRAEIAHLVNEVDREVGGQIEIAKRATRLAAGEFLEEVRKTLWEAPPDAIARGIIETASDEGVKTWALAKVATVANISDETAASELAGEYDTEASILQSYRVVEDAFLSLRDLEKTGEDLITYMSSMEPDNYLSKVAAIDREAIEKLSVGALFKALVGVPLFLTGTGMAAAAAGSKANMAKDTTNLMNFAPQAVKKPQQFQQ